MNLDLWLCIKSGTEYCLGSSSNPYTTFYSNDNIKDGKIQVKVPIYIKED